jgi:hypothetical protein
VADLEAYFASQLVEAGWTRVSGRTDDVVGWSSWLVPSEGEWRGLLVVLAAFGVLKTGGAGGSGASGLRHRYVTTMLRRAFSPDHVRQGVGFKATVPEATTSEQPLPRSSAVGRGQEVLR